jgi:phage-related holin
MKLMVYTALKRYILEIDSASLNKVMLILITSSTMVMIKSFTDKYFYSDWEYGFFLTLLITLDTISGVIRALKEKYFSSRRFGEDLAIKIVLYCIALMTVHIVTNFTINGTHPVFISYVDSLALSGFMLREAISIFENISVIKPSLFPTYILKRLKMFDESGMPISPTIHEKAKKEPK